jgi:predicted transposase YdaD
MTEDAALKKAKEDGREEGKAEGREEGREEGIEIGEAREREKTAINMLKHNADPEFISSVTGFSLDKVLELKDKI